MWDLSSISKVIQNLRKSWNLYCCVLSSENDMQFFFFFLEKTNKIKEEKKMKTFLYQIL